MEELRKYLENFALPMRVLSSSQKESITARFNKLSFVEKLEIQEEFRALFVKNGLDNILLAVPENVIDLSYAINRSIANKSTAITKRTFKDCFKDVSDYEKIIGILVREGFVIAVSDGRYRWDYPGKKNSAACLISRLDSNNYFKALSRKDLALAFLETFDCDIKERTLRTVHVEGCSEVHAIIPDRKSLYS